VPDDSLYILNLAPTGMIPDRRTAPHAPLIPAELARDVAAALPFGLTSVHIHARDEAGRPVSSADDYAPFVAAVREVAPELVLCVSCSGRADPGFESRSRVLDLAGDLKPDMGSLTLSSLNFANTASVNAPDTVVRLAEKMLDKGIKPELEIFDLGMVNYALYMIRKGYLQPPYYVNIILGNIAGAQADVRHLAALLHGLPEEAVVVIGGIGAQQLSANALGLIAGHGVRTGLEDNLHLDGRTRQPCSNADLLGRAVALAQALGKQPMPPAMLRKLLALQ
jgi:uncharacterized protein (DUF849 family)